MDDNILEELKKYSYKINTSELDKDLVSNCKYRIGKYNYGAVINKLLDDVTEFEVYCFVIDEKTSNIAPFLLYRQFNNEKEASKYYEYLANLLGNKNIEYLLELCQNQKKS